jgi:predicted MFS family arabinose efflux permease
MTAGQIAFSTPLSLGCQLIGGGLAIVLAPRVSWPTALGVSSVLLAFNLIGLSLLPSPLAFLALQAAFGALWMFITPYLTPFAIESDPTRRTALLANAAVLFGSAIGPLIASAMIGFGGAAVVLRICAALALVGMLLIQLLHLTGRPAAAKMAADIR